MKKLLSFLVSVVLLNVQVMAKSGGPTFSGGGGVRVIGTYSGVMIPETESGANITASNQFNSIGIFSLAVPETGIATGGFGFFGNGQVYNGVINGVADPDKATLNAILDATTTLQSPSGGTFIGQALGSMKGNIVPTGLNTGSGTSSAARINGTAHLDVFEGDFNADLSVAVASTFDFEVDGFKQSETATTTNLQLGSNGNNNGGGNGGGTGGGTGGGGIIIF